MVWKSGCFLMFSLCIAMGSTRSAFCQSVVHTAGADQNAASGISLRFESVKDKSIDARPSRLFALNVPAGMAPTPFMAPGSFKATFQGFIEQRIRSDYQFSAVGNGKLKVTVNDKPALEGDGDLAAARGDKVTLKKGKNKILVEFESPEQGDAVFRLLWAGDDFPAEPIDPKLLSHTVADPSLVHGLQLREGRNLFADLHCVRCHTDASLTGLKDGMPELAKDAPNLDEIGARLNPAWMARWISNPKSLRPDTSMPNLFHGQPGSTVQEASDIAAYLAMLGNAPSIVANPPPADVTAGGRIVARLGCIGCHTLPDKKIGAEAERVPWQFIKAKYKPAALAEFLKQPEKHYAWIRMPNFRMSDDEAKKVAAYLLNSSTDFDGPAILGDAVKGKRLVQTSGCVNCHGLKIENSFSAPAMSALTKASWTKGCLANGDSSRGKAPQFDLDDGKRSALIAFLSTDYSFSLKRDNPTEFATRQITELRCVACHTRDAKQDIWDDLIKETEGLLKGDTVDPENAGNVGPNALPGEPAPGTGDQSRPQLTWTGEKLYPEWMSRFIAGKLEYKPRAWMIARMPGFPKRAEGLSNGMALEHGCPTTSPELPAADAELATIGKQLAGRNGGFSCIQCHGIAAVPPVSPFEAPAINFKYIAERVRKDYYDRWMRNPARLVPITKMPAYADADGKTALREILEGDAPKQFDALWNYLLAGRKIEHPEQEPANP